MPETGRDVIEAPALAHALADAYHLRVIGLSPLEGGSLNSGYRVQATDGDFHLKCYDGRIYQPDQIRRSIEAQEYVGRSDVPVPAVRRNVYGDVFTEIPGVGSVVLSTFMQGSHRRRGSIPARAASAMGRTLGTLQHILAPLDEPRPYAFPLPAEAQTRLEAVLGEPDGLLLAPLTLYLSCTRAWPITARYMHRDAYQPRWDRFIGEPSSWWEDHVDELTERLVSLCRHTAMTEQ